MLVILDDMRGPDADAPLAIKAAVVEHEPEAPVATSSGMDRAFRWLTVLSIPVASILVMRVLYAPISNPDTFWHLRLGEHLLDTWQFSGPEPWSSLATRPLVLHEWVPELVYTVGYRL